APAQPKSAPAPKDHIWITTTGPFAYDLARNNGRFDIPEKPSGIAPEKVVVHRNPKNPLHDELECEHLELQFRRKTPAPQARSGAQPPQADDAGPNLEIEWAHAWGKKVVIESKEEQLTAEGNDLYHEAGPHKTVLKGTPHAGLLKEFDEIRAPELEMI